MQAEAVSKLEADGWQIVRRKNAHKEGIGDNRVMMQRKGETAFVEPDGTVQYSK